MSIFRAVNGAKSRRHYKTPADASDATADNGNTTFKKFRSRGKGFEEKAKTFYEKYVEFCEEKGCKPKIKEFAAYIGENYQTLHITLTPLEAGKRIRYVRSEDPRRKEIEITDEEYFKNIVAGKKEVAVSSNIGFGTDVNELLKNPFIKGYLSEVLGNPNGSNSEKTSEEAVKIMGLFGSNADKFTDEKISEDSGLSLNRTRRHLTILKEKGIFSYDVIVDDRNWSTYDWYFKGPENLRNCYISNTEERIEDLEEKVSKIGANPKYVCEMRKKDNPDVFEKGHPVILDFNSNLAEENGYACPECKKHLVLKTGDELAAPLKEDIRILLEGIENVKKINRNCSAKNTEQAALA